MNEEERIRNIVTILRRTTVVVKVMPFVFVFAQIVCILAFMFTINEETAFLDLLCYVSPLVIFFEFILSYLLKMCVWHRLECSLPLIPLSSVVVNDYLCEITSGVETLNFAFVLFLFLSSLVNGYMLFCKRK